MSADKKSSRHLHKIKTVRFTPAQRAFLEGRAKRLGKSVNEQIRELVEREMIRAGSPA